MPGRKVDVGVDAGLHIVATVIGFVLAWIGFLRIFLAVLSVVGTAEIGGGDGRHPRSVWRTWIPSGALLFACGTLLASYGLGQGPALTSPRAVIGGPFLAIAPLVIFSLAILILSPLTAWLSRKIGWTFKPLPLYAAEALLGTVLAASWFGEYLSRSPHPVSYLLSGLLFSIPAALHWVFVWTLIRKR